MSEHLTAFDLWMLFWTIVGSLASVFAVAAVIGGYITKRRDRRKADNEARFQKAVTAAIEEHSAKELLAEMQADLGQHQKDDNQQFRELKRADARLERKLTRDVAGLHKRFDAMVDAIREVPNTIKSALPDDPDGSDEGGS